MKNEHSAGVVIFIESPEGPNYLLLHYPTGHWDFVKGKIEKGENIRQTAIREAQEETGIKDLEFIEGFEEKISYNFQYEGELIHKDVIFFLAKTKTRQVNVSHEHLDYLWLNFENSLKKITYSNARNILSKVNKLIG